MGKLLWRTRGERNGVPPHAKAPGGSHPSPTRATRTMGLRLAVAAIARVGLAVVYAPLKLLPTRRKVVMMSREHPTLPKDFAAIRESLERLDPAVEVVTLVRMVPPGYVAKLGYALHMIKQLYHVATARVLILDTYAIVASVLKHKDSLTIMQIWHALGAFKKFGLSILGQAEGRDERLAAAMRMHQGYDIVLASGEAAREPFAEALGTSLDRVVVAPLPRVDKLRDPGESRRIRDRIYSEYPHLRDARIAVYAPTFHIDGSVSVDVGELTAALEARGIHAVVKLHPLMSANFEEGIDTASGFSTQELLHVADLFITDYSSVLFEASVLGVPSYFLAPDLEDYLASRDFYLDYRTELPGPIVESIPELVDEIARGSSSSEEVAEFAASWVRAPGDTPPEEGETPCADQIARLALDAIG